MAVSFVCRRISHVLHHTKSVALGRRLCTSPVRCVSTNKAHKLNLWEEYTSTKARVEAQPLPQDRDQTAIYANNELDLGDIDVYGFDYDYTLACYNESLHQLIYNLGRSALIQELKYPVDLEAFDFNPNFAVRGLHVDVMRGLLLKIDAFHNIQMGCVYRGLTPVSEEEVKKLYYGTHVSIENMSSFYGTGQTMHQLMDLFAIPEMTLLSNVIQYFINEGIDYDPEYVFHDVKTAVQGLHSSGVLHQMIMENLDKFIGSQLEIAALLHRLKAAGKRLFLITNSSVNFVGCGMTYLCGPQWNELFDVVITNARKPKFFYDENRPFRSFNATTGQRTWNTVDRLEKGQFYQEGNFYQLSELTGWKGSRVLYFGDHVYTDLADATLKHGWRTGAIIPELEHEIKTFNSDVFKNSVRWLITLEGLIERVQPKSGYSSVRGDGGGNSSFTIPEHKTLKTAGTQRSQKDPESQAVMKEWLKERHQLRLVAKNIFNPQFGSIFRTYHNPTYFTRRLNRFADIYTSSVVNLLHYPMTHTFYPRRSALPHELEFQGLP